MPKINYKPGPDNSECLGISKERKDEIIEQLTDIEVSLNKLLANDECPQTDYLLEQASKIPETMEEAMFCGWLAGRRTSDLIHERNPLAFLDGLGVDDVDDNCDCEGCKARRAAGVPNTINSIMESFIKKSGIHE